MVDFVLKYKNISFVFLFALAACTGTMNGVVRGTGEVVQINYEQGMSSDTLNAVIDGENFTGKSIVGSTGTSGVVFDANFGTNQIFSQTSNGEAKAVLIGDRGRTMRCDLKYASPFGETTAGGVGVCVLDERTIIDIIW